MATDDLTGPGVHLHMMDAPFRSMNARAALSSSRLRLGMMPLSVALAATTGGETLGVGPVNPSGQVRARCQDRGHSAGIQSYLGVA